MVKVYANLIINGRRTIDDVPESLKESVIQELKKRGYELTRGDLTCGK